MSRTFEIMQACMLSGLGDILYRSGAGHGKPEQCAADYLSGKLTQDAIDAIRYQRAIAEEAVELSENSLAYIVNAARIIALGCEENTESITDPALNTTGLESIFNHLNQGSAHIGFRVDWEGYFIQYPSEVLQNDSASYQRAWAQWEKLLDPKLFDVAHFNALLKSMEQCFSYIPASGQSFDRHDIPIIHQSKATAAIGCCIERWLKRNGKADYRNTLISEKTAFLDAEPFVLFSLDLSGIQSFIYTISNKGALKGLRVRSFYLSMLMEHVIDMILEACHLFRVNLIYSGGGRAQLLLPNDGQCLNSAQETVRIVNHFLRKHFGASLFLACGYAVATVRQLSAAGGKTQGFSGLFREASRNISQQKLQRYSTAELLDLNHKDEHHSSDRECVICGRSGHLVPHGESDMVCTICDRLERFSSTLTENNLLLKVGTEESYNAIPLPGGMWLSRTESFAQTDDIIRMYCINGALAPLPHCTWLHTGNYRAANADGTPMTFQQLAEASSGIKRLGVLRADVDNLGMLFATGLLASGETNPHRFETLSRYMALSDAMTNFFQKEINRIVSQPGATWVPDSKSCAQRNVSIVYSGGDDVFLVGAWNEVLDAGLALQEAFHRYTGGSVTLSAGLGLFTPHEPVGVMADVTAELEENAKLIGDGSKNAVALFSPVSVQSGVSFDFHWNALRQNIMGEKLPLLYRTFREVFTDQQEAGNAFLYQILALLRDIAKSPIAIARLAYLLARHAPEKKRNLTEAEKLRIEHYDDFSKHVYKWALEPDENRALQAAILLHVYSNRRERDSGV